jgi:alpha-glucosidase
MTSLSRGERQWWRGAVTYQIYIRSFADGNGDGIGDIEGIRSKIPYLKSLGVDAIWITPWYPSPQKDHGYDVANYMDIEPMYGSLDEAQALINQAHESGLKIIVDIVPNHSSDQHVWFQEAVKSPIGSAARDRYIFRDGKGDNGELPPNNWQSVFGGPAWHRLVDSDGNPEQWYLHLFAVEQPDFNWENNDVREHFEGILKFWLDRGVDGFRIDVAHALMKYPGLPDIPPATGLEVPGEFLPDEYRPMWDQDGVHEIYRRWRTILNSYPGDRMAVAEAWVSPASRIARYLRPDELANSFNFDFLTSLWEPKYLTGMINRAVDAMAEVGAPPSWVFNNHDVTRSVDRFDLGLQNQQRNTIERQGDPSKLDLARGTRRARAGALLMLALPGGAYIYQGEELALPEVRDIPENRLTDPIWKMSEYKDRGRDGCRVPMPWNSSPVGAFGFSSNQSLTPDQAWLPQSHWWGSYSAESQVGVAGSTHTLYSQALALRKSEAGLGDGEMRWIEAGADVLAFSRAGDFACYVNFGAPIDIPKGADILLSSQEISGNQIPTDTTIWLRLNS